MVQSFLPRSKAFRYRHRKHLQTQVTYHKRVAYKQNVERRLIMQNLYEQRNDLIKLLNDCISYKKTNGRKLAEAECEYKKARTMLMTRMMLDGYEVLQGKTKPIAATAVYNLAQGDEEVAALKLERDLRQADADVTQEKIYSIKLQINIIEEDLRNIRKGV
jgi:hypothetical protein